MSELNKISLRERIRLNLVASMERAGINQVQLADKLGLKKGTINNWVKGNNSPDIDMVPKICSVLGISVLDYYSPTPYETVEIPTVSPPFFSILDKQILERYHALDSHGKEMVDLVMDKETERMEAEAARKERDAMEAGMIAPPVPTPEEEAKAEAESFYQEVLQEKKIQAELSASPSTNGTGEKMA